MTEANVSFAGNLTDHPEVRYTDSGIARAMFRVAVSSRREQEPSFFTVITGRLVTFVAACGSGALDRTRPIQREPQGQVTYNLEGKGKSLLS
jgi:Single-strand binding protein family